MKCNHDLLIIDGGSMARRTDNAGRPCLICQVCYYNPASAPRRERGGNDMFTAIAENTTPAPEWKSVDVLADFDS